MLINRTLEGSFGASLRAMQFEFLVMKKYNYAWRGNRFEQAEGLKMFQTIIQCNLL